MLVLILDGLEGRLGNRVAILILEGGLEERAGNSSLLEETVVEEELSVEIVFFWRFWKIGVRSFLNSSSAEITVEIVEIAEEDAEVEDRVDTQLV